MGALLPFPAAGAANPRIGRMRCDDCGAAPSIFVPMAPLVLAFCGPAHAARCGVEPWHSTPVAERAAWAAGA